MDSSNDLIYLRFPDNFGRAWIELLESDLSEHARICYVAMTSFGKESRAGKESIRRRMGVKSLSTVKAAQAELIKAGWIKRRVMGGGIKPTEWEVFQRPFDGQLPLLGDETPGRNAPQLPSAPEISTQRPAPGHEAAPKQEYKHESNQEKLHKGKHPDQDQFWKFAEATFKVSTGQALLWPPAKGFQKQMTDALTTLGVEELSRRWDIYLAYPFGQKSPLGFFYDLNKWAKLQTSSGGQRAFVQPTTDWKSSGAKAPH